MGFLRWGWHLATVLLLAKLRSVISQVAPPPREVIARYGESAVLPCDVQYPNGVLPFVIEWQRQGVAIPVFILFNGYPPHIDPQFQGRVSLFRQASLRIDKVLAEDAGWYECKVVFLDRVDNTRKNGTWVHLKVYARPTFLDKSPALLQYSEGDTGRLFCVAAGHPPPQVRWKKGDQAIMPTVRYRLTETSLTIVSLVRGDAGVYTCTAQSEAGELQHTMRMVIFGPPVIMVPPQNTTGVVGSEVAFECQAESFPANMTMRWLRDGINVFYYTSLYSRVNVLGDGTLIIRRLRRSDVGMYTCSPTNGIGVAPRATAYLRVQYPPQLLPMPATQLIPRGGEGRIRCPHDADPPIHTILWKKNGRVLDVAADPSLSVDRDGTLVIAGVTDMSGGLYSCIPRNVLGSGGESPYVQVSVTDPPEFTVQPEPSYYITVGEDITMRCAAMGEPMPFVSWRKDGIDLDDELYDIAGGNLSLWEVTKEDYGVYVCLAQNEVTTISATSHVFIQGTSPHVPTDLSVTTSSNSAHVTWRPSYDGGSDQTFIIWYRAVTARDWNTLQVNGDVNRYTVYNLVSSTEYEFSVLARNRLGDSLFTTIVVKATQEPGYVDPYKPLPPEDLTANITEEGVMLSWLAPPHPTLGKVVSYAVEYRQEGKTWRILQENIAAENTSVLVADDLYRQTTYEFRVFAFSEVTFSEPSDVITVYTEDIPVYTDPVEMAGQLGVSTPVLAGVAGGLSFLLLAILLSCFAVKVINKRKVKRKEQRQENVKLISLSKLAQDRARWTPQHNNYSNGFTNGNGFGGHIKNRFFLDTSQSSPDSFKSKSASEKPSMSSQDKNMHIQYDSPSMYKLLRSSRNFRYNVEITRPIGTISRAPDGRFILGQDKSVTNERRHSPYQTNDILPVPQLVPPGRLFHISKDSSFCPVPRLQNTFRPIQQEEVTPSPTSSDGSYGSGHSSEVRRAMIQPTSNRSSSKLSLKVQPSSRSSRYSRRSQRVVSAQVHSSPELFDTTQPVRYGSMPNQSLQRYPSSASSTKYPSNGLGRYSGTSQTSFEGIPMQHYLNTRPQSHSSTSSRESHKVYPAGPTKPPRHQAFREPAFRVSYPYVPEDTRFPQSSDLDFLDNRHSAPVETLSARRLNHVFHSTPQSSTSQLDHSDFTFGSEQTLTGEESEDKSYKGSNATLVNEIFTEKKVSPGRASSTSASSGRGSKTSTVAISRGSSFRTSEGYTSPDHDSLSSGFVSKNTSHNTAQGSRGDSSDYISGEDGPFEFTSSEQSPVSGSTPHPTDADEHFEWDRAEPVASNILQAVQKYIVQGRSPLPKQKPRTSESKPPNPREIRRHRRISRFSDVDARCAALKQEFQEYKQRQKEIGEDQLNYEQEYERTTMV
ncbi:IGSF9B [Branchiostoma lanceolatum]|uniref:IGSF9B protein n=1 Tax=Branchiostoma lanceolatum TaxID=7740 RepID=A0A8J9ZXG1_BRALA|nr:IGSF9B [Branchiostoma lanceolatum]